MTLFNAEYYLEQNPDVAQAGMDAQWHYQQYGAHEAYTLGAASRTPAPWFDIVHYLNTYPDLAQAFGDNPGAAFDHFVTYGLAEWRSPSQGLVPRPAGLSEYAALNEDLQTAFGIGHPDVLTPTQQIQLLTHFYQYGWYEERPGSPFSDSAEVILTLKADAPWLGGFVDHLIDAPLLRDSGGQWQQSLNAYDTLVAGEGYDILRAVLNGVDAAPGALYNPVIEGVEDYRLTVAADAQYTDADGNLVRGALLDLGRASGYEYIHNDLSQSDLHLINVNAQDTVVLELDVPGSAVEGVIVVPETTRIDYDGAQASGITQYVNARVIGGGEGGHHLHVTGVDIDTLNLVLSGQMRLSLEGTAAQMATFELEGGASGDVFQFQPTSDRLEVVDTFSYNGDVMLTLALTDTPDLRRVLTGEGDDWVMLASDAIHEDLWVNLGRGDNTLLLIFPTVAGDEPDDRYIDAALLGDLDFTGGFQGVNTLELSSFGHDPYFVFGEEDVVLNLAGMGAALDTVHISNIFSAGYALTVENVPGDALSLVTGASHHMFLDFPDLDGTLTLHSEAGQLSLGVVEPGPPFMGGLYAPHVEVLNLGLGSEADMSFVSVGLNSHGGALDSLLDVVLTSSEPASAYLKLRSSIPVPDRPNNHFTELARIDLTEAKMGVYLDASAAIYGAPTVQYRVSLGPNQLIAEDLKAAGTAEQFRFYDGDIPGFTTIENFWMGHTGREGNRDLLSLLNVSSQDIVIGQGNFTNNPLQGYNSDLMIRSPAAELDNPWTILLVRVLDTQGRDGVADHTVEDFVINNLTLGPDFGWEEGDVGFGLL